MADPRITDEAVAAARHLYWERQAGGMDGLSAMRAVLEAALPQPITSREPEDKALEGIHRWYAAMDSDVDGDLAWPSGLSADNPNLTPAVPQPVVDREALEKLAARYEALAGPEREFDEHSIMSLREEARTGAYRLAARELRALLNGTAK